MPSLKHIVVDTLCRRRQQQLKKHFTLFSELDLQIKSGQRLGIIGANGSGKSSLLRLIAGIYRPQSGQMEVNGDITPLFGLGLGIHPELSGYKNIIASGLHFGGTPKEMRCAAPGILEFAGLEKFADMPFKNYSNGMRARLLFSIAVHSTPQILALDEVFAGGDAEFQGKAERKLMEMIDECEILLFASHSLDLVKTICNRAIWMDHGQILADGEPADVCEQYLAGMN